MFEKHPNRLWTVRAKKPGQIWVGDVTYLKVEGRWRYLAVVLDQYSRRLVGWSMGRVKGGALTRSAFNRAMRHAPPGGRLVFHSDRGSEYAGEALGRRLRELGVLQSMTRGGTPSDNAHAESFFHSLKAEMVHGARFKDEGELRHEIRRYVRFYNHQRLHSSLGYLSPLSFERRAA